MTKMLEQIFARYGSEIRVERGEETAYTDAAFVQLARNSEKEYPFTVTGLGNIDDRYWLCLTRREIREGDRVWFRGSCYEAVNCAAMELAGETAYWRTILRLEQEAAV